MGTMSLTSCRALSTPGKFSNVDRYVIEQSFYELLSNDLPFLSFSLTSCYCHGLLQNAPPPQVDTWQQCRVLGPLISVVNTYHYTFWVPLVHSIYQIGVHSTVHFSTSATGQKKNKKPVLLSFCIPLSNLVAKTIYLFSAVVFLYGSFYLAENPLLPVYLYLPCCWQTTTSCVPLFTLLKNHYFLYTSFHLVLT